MKRGALTLSDAQPVERASPPATPALPPADAAVPALASAETSAPPGGAQSLAVSEVLTLRPALLSVMPLPSTVLCARDEDAGGGLVVLTTSRQAYEAARERRLPVFVGGEIGELALAAENDRAYPPQLAAWCARKLEDPGWRLNRAVALGAMPTAGLPLAEWTLEQVAGRVGLRVLWAGCGDELPVELGGAPATEAA